MNQTTTELWRKVTAPLAIIAYSGFLTWLYWPVLFIFFSSDDWVFLNYVRKIPLEEYWRYFSPKTIWYYRPFHLIEFDITYRLADLNPIPYNVQLLFMFVLCSFLLWRFLRLLFPPGIAAMSAILFSVSPKSPDMLMWKSNFGSLQNAIFTLLACYTYTRYLQGRRKSWLALTITLAFLNCFAKESCINLPLVLGAVALTVYLQNYWALSRRPAWNMALKNFIWPTFRQLWPIIVIVIIYIISHKLTVENIDPNRSVGNPITNFTAVISQFFTATSFSLFHFVWDPVFLRHLGKLRLFLTDVVLHWYVLPILILLIGAWKKLPVAIFCVTFAAANIVPMFALKSFFHSRYYFLSGIGENVMIAALVYYGFQYLSNGKGHVTIWRKTLGYGAVVFFCWILASSIVNFQQVIGNYRIQSTFFENTFNAIQREHSKLPDRAVLVVKNAPFGFLNPDIGPPEMMELATGRANVLCLAEKNYEIFKDQLVEKGWGELYRIDVKTLEPHIEKMPDTEAAISDE